MKFIDLEHHSFTQEFFDTLSKRTTAPKFDAEKKVLYHRDGGFGYTLGTWRFNSPNATNFDEISNFGDLRISEMDEAGCSNAMLSSAQTAEDLPEEEGVAVCRAANDKVAETVRKYPDRFYGAFCLPTRHVDAALEEMDRAVNVLGLKFWHTHSNYGTESLWQEKFMPIFAKLAEYDVPFYVHPNTPTADFLSDYGPVISGPALGFGVDVMNTTMRIVLNGTFDMYPNLRMVIGHMGEYYPFSVDRIDNRSFDDPHNNNKHPFRYYFENKNIFFTTSGVFNVQSFMCARDTFSIENILFASDYPYECLKRGIDFVKSLPISDEEKEMIAHGNAEKYILR